jgi:hypothetical protein
MAALWLSLALQSRTRFPPTINLIGPVFGRRAFSEPNSTDYRVSAITEQVSRRGRFKRMSREKYSTGQSLPGLNPQLAHLSHAQSH